MSKCFNCQTEFTLKDQETKCDKCGKVVNFPCWNCKKWFGILTDNNERQKECKVCGFFECPYCGECGEACSKDVWCRRLKEILGNDLPSETYKQLLDMIEEIKVGKERRECPKGVSISYAKNRIKSCIVRMMGYRIKDKEDLEKFKERYEKLLDVTLGTELTVNQSRDKGSYGQEFRDVFNYAICMGKLKKKIKVIKEGEEEKEYEVFERIEGSQCSQLDINKLIIKVCSNPKCQIKEYPLSETHCCYCKYKKGKKIGQFFPLKVKISNKDTCQLARGEFKKNGESESI